ncbi:MAG TPA: hypothetical protein VLG11_00890 [Candidatus Saccharimonadales bacterium]|nr:hypothetical protein [Candidatus Saccharimonadales bacterium]
MAYEIERLPSDTSLNWDAQGRLRCIMQGEAAFFMHYDVPFYSEHSNVPRELAPSEAASLACRIVGLSNGEAGAYLGVPGERIKRELGNLNKRLGIESVGHDTGGYRPLQALGQLAQRGVIELGEMAGQAWEPKPLVYKLVEGFFAGKDLAGAGKEYGLTGMAVSGRIQYCLRKTHLEHPIAYALHLMAAGVVGDINFKPRLMDELPSLSLVPPEGTGPITLRKYGRIGRRVEVLPPDVQFYWDADDYLTCIQQRDGMLFMRYDVSANPDDSNGASLAQPQGLIAACRFVGLSHRSIRQYLNKPGNSVNAHLSSAYRCTGLIGDSGNVRHVSLSAMGRLAKAGAIEVGKSATLTHEPTPEVLGFTESLLEGSTLGQVSRATGHDATYIIKQMREAYEAAGFQSAGGYVLHLLAARKAGQINYNPARMQELPSLVTSPASLS